MSITTRVEFLQSSKAVSAHVKVESDTLSGDEVLEMAKDLAIKAQAEASEMTMSMM